MAVGHGGQVLCSSITAELVGDSVTLVDLGVHRLRDLDRPMRVFQAGNDGRTETEPSTGHLRRHRWNAVGVPGPSGTVTPLFTDVEALTRL